MVAQSATKSKRGGQAGVCRASGRHYNGQFRPGKFAMELQERLKSAEQMADYHRGVLEMAKQKKCALTVGRLALALAADERNITTLKAAIEREERSERGVSGALLDEPFYEGAGA